MSFNGPSSSSINVNTTNSLQQVKLLSALRNGDAALIESLLNDIVKATSITDNSQGVAAALHLAHMTAKTVALVLGHLPASPNMVYPPESGTTALHLAAFLGRTDIVNLFLETKGVDDTLKDQSGQNCRDVAKGNDVRRAIDDSHALLNATYRSLLRTYILSPITEIPEALIEILDSPRIRHVDLSYLDDASGRSILHEAARRKDLGMIDKAVRGGADVFVRDRKGKTVQETAGKDDRVKVFLRQFANQDKSLISSPTTGPFEMKGYLNKYVNVAKGYSTRWFVIKDGTLSYYRHQDEEHIATRGSFSLRTAYLKVAPSGDKLRFEVISPPSHSKPNSAPQKWFIKANHRVEAARWTRAIQQSMDLARRGAAGEDTRRVSGESESVSVKKPGSIRSILKRRKIGQSQSLNHAMDSSSSLQDTGNESVHSNHSTHTLGTPPVFVEAPRNDDDSMIESTGSTPPHEDTFGLHANATSAQVLLTTELLAGLRLPEDTPASTLEIRTALRDSIIQIQKMVDEYSSMSNEREQWWREKIKKEQERQAIWEESLQVAVKEGEVLEYELRSTMGHRTSRKHTNLEQLGNLDTIGRQKPSTSQEQPNADYNLSHTDESYFTATAIASGMNSQVNKVEEDTEPAASLTKTKSLLTPTPRRLADITAGLDTPRASLNIFDSEEEDEFFDAIDEGSIPNLEVPEALKPVSSPVSTIPPAVNVDQYAAYQHLRERLPIGNDNRPNTSLWSVLKNSIGKDLTKISFPVSFNEPTSMLQRMAEDMEFSECLDAAAQDEDPLRRIAFVAAFAMSNYSSTIGRIAKPFNPMLSETFEYVRFDKEFRYVSEQVSHHPPISACYAESPRWHYYGEVDAQNKFMGKSFEIRPTGVAHCDLLLPAKWGLQYPPPSGKHTGELVSEHYSWKKVTTNVSGFIFGQPTIDHYGEMTITNHRTKDQCILNFKPRGWRGRDAFEISGFVRNANGRVIYNIAGRWNNQLIAKPASDGSSQLALNPDTLINGPDSPSQKSDYLLLWRNTEKPAAPFNLTPFAITLNDCPADTLRPYLCYTDCRLRPDQRAFEEGRYDLANDLKSEQEEKQRAIRRAREDGRMAPHSTRWFMAETDRDTGERVWSPRRVNDELEYWVEREAVWRSGGKKQWKDVDRIFIESD